MFSLDWELAVYDAAEDSGGEKAPLLDIDGGIVIAVESSQSSSLWWSESELSAQLSLLTLDALDASSSDVEPPRDPRFQLGPEV